MNMNRAEKKMKKLEILKQAYDQVLSNKSWDENRLKDLETRLKEEPEDEYYKMQILELSEAFPIYDEVLEAIYKLI
jgi:hypothetical protein